MAYATPPKAKPVKPAKDMTYNCKNCGNKLPKHALHTRGRNRGM